MGQQKADQNGALNPTSTEDKTAATHEDKEQRPHVQKVEHSRCKKQEEGDRGRGQAQRLGWHGGPHAQCPAGMLGCRVPFTFPRFSSGKMNYTVLSVGAFHPSPLLLSLPCGKEKQIAFYNSVVEKRGQQQNWNFQKEGIPFGIWGISLKILLIFL